MKVPWSWLRAYCAPELSVQELAGRLAMHSIEVERISHLGVPSAEGFVVGKVLSAEQHPDADRLRICEVDTGDEARTIVCGAPNVAAGQTVAVALPGAVMPDGTKLGKAKLRGVESDGMILSETELELGDDSTGITVLSTSTASPPGVDRPDEVWAPGTPLAEVLPISDPVIELEPTSNRVDCFGIYGVAREVHAITDAELAPPPWNADAEATGEGEIGDYASVTVEVPELCPRFSARVFTDVTIGPSPLWLKARLLGAGMRPINNVVDITNYVMLMTAQPLHAFDLDKVPDGALTVRRAHEGETMTTLDGVERTFDGDAVLVCDRSGPSGIAGIMGGQVSEVSDSTTRVLLEVATWNGVNILRTSRNLGLRSDASNRFEKQLHPELALRAQRVASRLIVELCGARLVPGTIDVTADVPQPHRVSLRSGRAERLLGMPIDPEEAVSNLRKLEFDVDAETDGALVATVPFHRHYDVTREADLVEEVGRIHGYSANLPPTLPGRGAHVGGLSHEQALRRRAEDLLRDLGFSQVVSLSLVDPGVVSKLRIDSDDLRSAPIRVSNPLSGDHSVLRTTLVGSLLAVAQHNLARGADGVAVFESGRAYLPHPCDDRFPGERAAPANEPQRLGALAAGPLRPADWRGGGEQADFFTVKGVLEALARGLGCELTVERGAEPFLHTGRTGRVLLDGVAIGWVGEIHPLVCAAWDLDSASGFEIDVLPLIAASPAGTELYEDVISYPAVSQDVAIVVAEDAEASAVIGLVRDAGGELLRELSLFDIYRGEQLGEGRKSLALRLEFRAHDRTLTDDEVAGLRERIRAAVAEVGGAFRE